MPNSPKQRLLVLNDFRGWALDHVFQAVRPILESRFHIEYRTVAEVSREGCLGSVTLRLPLAFRLPLQKGFFRSFRGTFAFYSLLLKHLYPQARDTAGCGVHCHYEFTDNRSPETLTRTLDSPSHGFLDRLGKRRLIGAPSRRLVSILAGCGLRARHLPYGVDPALFFPAATQRGRGRLRVGWCQSETNHTFKRRIAEIRGICARLPGVELVETPQDRPIRDRNEMRDWYNSLDCYVCFSICEGGPMPVLEAMACGVPCVSTLVGHVPEIVEDGVNGWIVKNESGLESTLKLLADNRSLLASAGKRAREAIMAQRTPEAVGRYWIGFFEEMTTGA